MKRLNVTYFFKIASLEVFRKHEMSLLLRLGMISEVMNLVIKSGGRS